MAKKDDDFLKRLLATFRVEAGEHLRSMSSGLIELEKASSSERRTESLETIFREAHSLKGAARAVSQTEIETICQSLEHVFGAWKRKEVKPSAELFDQLHRAVDILGRILSLTEPERSDKWRTEMAAVAQGLESASKGTVIPPAPELQPPAVEPRPPTPFPADTVRISAARLDPLLLQAEELVSAKLAANERAVELQEVAVSFAEWKKSWTKIYRELSATNRFRTAESGFPLSESAEEGNNALASIESKLVRLSGSMEQDRRFLGQLADNLLEDAKRALMLPFSWLLGIFPKLVRDLSRDQDKDMELIIEGGDIEADRRILQEMKNPLIHLVRNCVDHGIEKPDERERKKKPPRGTITIDVAQKDSKLEIAVSDDGAGIELPKLREAALRSGAISKEEADKLTDQETLALIFQSGISTSQMITDISGRGLGLAIVREKVEKLGGAVSVETRADLGATFRLFLPMTLATFRGVLVRVGDHSFVVPAANLERTVRVKREEIRTVENRETILLDGETLSLARLEEALEIPRNAGAQERAETAPVVVLRSGEKRVGFSVEEILHEQEVLAKSLGKQLSRVRNIAGATVLGTGKVVPILNVPDLMKSAVRAGAVFAAPAAAPPEKEEERKKAVLVVEDSITARTLLKGILEGAGYEVKTAVDGVDGFTQLRAGEFDIVISDVDMPRMNGFDLTAKIRADRKLSETPVVLVTALESREDRERGIDVGANAYIVKSSFDQSNLLEAIRRLIS